MSASEKRLGRRHALAGLGLAAGAALPIVGGLAARGQSAPEPARATSRPEDRPDALEAHDLRAASDDVRALFGTLREGDVVGRCRIEAIYAERAGAIPVVMSTAGGQRFAIEIFASDPHGPAPISSASSLALFLVNRGDGASATPEDVGVGVRALGRALADRMNEEGAVPPSGLVSYAERRRRAPTGVFHVPV
jgi:hypothetical protein